MSVNIPKSADDLFYRYKRPKIAVTQIKQGIQITNIDDIAKALDRHYTEITKYIQSQMKLNIITKKQGNKNILYLKNNNNIDIDDIIESYIELFVLCKICKNPETIYISEKKNIFLECRACGEKSSIQQNKNIKINPIKISKPKIDPTEY